MRTAMQASVFRNMNIIQKYAAEYLQLTNQNHHFSKFLYLNILEATFVW